MAILNYSTKVSADKTITDIQQALIKRGVRKITVDYDTNSLPCNLTFNIILGEQMAFFSLPCRFKNVLKVMIKQRVPRSFCTEEQALRVGWRILKVWIDAQMAIADTEMVDLAEIFLPYVITQAGITLYELIADDKAILMLK